MSKITCDAAARAAGYTRELELSSSEYDLRLLVKPETDLGDSFRAWDIECQEFIRVCGWLFS